MPEFEVEVPLGGLVLGSSYSKQPPMTSRDLQNVRAIDPITLRQRMAQRPGFTKFNDNQVATGKIQDLAHVIFDNKLITYAQATPGAEEVVFSTGEGRRNSRAAAVDVPGNGYFIAGFATVVKVNSAGRTVFEIPLPTADKEHACRALEVDDADRIIAGVSEGGTQRTARLFCYTQHPDTETGEQAFQLLWQLEEGGYYEDARVVGDKLYVLFNRPDRAQAQVRVYSNYGAPQLQGFGGPTLSQTYPVAFPAHGFDAREDGSVYVATAENTRNASTLIRAGSPASNAFMPTIVDWNPVGDLDRYEYRVWSHLKAEDVTINDVATDGQLMLRDGARVLVWRDSSGHNRHLFYDPNLAPPTWIENGPGGRPAIRFDGTQGFLSGGNPGISKANADQHRSLIPSYTGAQYAIFLVIQPAVEDTKSLVFYQDTTGSIADELLAANRRSNSSAFSGDAAGYLSWHTEDRNTDPFNGSGDRPLERLFTTNTGAVVVCILNDGNLNTEFPRTPDRQRATFRVDGFPVDRATCESRTSAESVYVGSNQANANTRSNYQPYKGTISEILVLERRDRDDDTAGILDAPENGPDHGTGEDNGPGAQPSDEMTLLEAYFAYKFGIALQLPDDSGDFEHPYAINSGIPAPAPDGAGGAASLVLSGPEVLQKYSATGELLWALGELSELSGGWGWGVRIGLDNDIFVTGGPQQNTLPDVRNYLHRIIDEGDTFSRDPGDGAWDAAYDLGRSAPDYAWPRMDVDLTFGRTFLPWGEDADNEATVRAFRRNGVAGVAQLVTSIVLPDGQQGRAVAIDPNQPDFSGQTSPNMPEAIYIGSSRGGDPTDPVIHRVRLLTIASRSGAVRSSAVLAVGDGDIWTVPDGVAVPTIPAGGPGALDATARYVQSVATRGEVVWTDGMIYRVYTGKTARVAELVSETAGAIAPRCLIVEFWADRLFLGHDPDDPAVWHLSAAGNIRDWDRFPPVPNAGQAISGSLAEDGPGGAPDIITGFAPIDDQNALIGGDHTLHLMRGNPADGGEIDLLSTTIGMAFGRAWCKDPFGRVYFVSNKGGIYRFSLGRGLEWLSQHSIDHSLQQIDFSTHFVRMAYDDRRQGVLVYLCAFGSMGTVVDHWWFDERSEQILGRPPFFRDVIDSTIRQPSALVVTDGDLPGDRSILVGHMDGFVRRIDEEAADDDGTRIESWFVAGPLPKTSPFLEHRYKSWQVTLSEDSDGALVELHTTDDPDRLGAPVTSFAVSRGLNGYSFRTVRGRDCFLRLSNRSIGERWALEMIAGRVYPSGRIHGRART